MTQHIQPVKKCECGVNLALTCNVHHNVHHNVKSCTFCGRVVDGVDPFIVILGDPTEQARVKTK